MKLLPYIDTSNISNVYIYVGDAVREDYLPDKIAKKGVTITTVAASTHSPSSFASISTGLHVPHHGVDTFSNLIPEYISTIFEVEDYDTAFMNSIFKYATMERDLGEDPIYDVLREEPTEIAHPFDELSEPFIFMERGPGGHAPYGEFDGTSTEYFTNPRTKTKQAIRTDYQKSIDLDKEFFLSRLNQMKMQGVRENTLVIYTSDHGELLGEGGLLGHNDPMRPELVYVPTVFITPDTKPRKFTESVIHHVDIAPTIFDLLSIEENHDFDGKPITSFERNTPRPAFWSNKFFDTPIPRLSGELSYEGVWDSHGGRVFPQNHLGNRMTVLLAKVMMSPKKKFIRNNLKPALFSNIKGRCVYGNPNFTTSSSIELLKEINNTDVDAESMEHSEAKLQTLRDLGYIE